MNTNIPMWCVHLVVCLGIAASFGYQLFHAFVSSKTPANPVYRSDKTYRTYEEPTYSPGFESHQKLVDHWGKHGAEFGNITMDDYLKMAQHLRDAPVGGDVEELIRDDGIASRFDRSSGAFIAFNPDRTIRTFFKPNDGESYFRRQARR